MIYYSYENKFHRKGEYEDDIHNDNDKVQIRNKFSQIK